MQKKGSVEETNWTIYILVAMALALIIIFFVLRDKILEGIFGGI